MNEPTIAPVKKEILGQIDNLTSRVDRLETLIKELQGDLSPILLASIPSVTQDSNKSGTSSIIGGNLEVLVARITEVNEQIAKLMDRLAI